MLLPPPLPLLVLQLLLPLRVLLLPLPLLPLAPGAAMRVRGEAGRLAVCERVRRKQSERRQVLLIFSRPHSSLTLSGSPQEGEEEEGEAAMLRRVPRSSQRTRRIVQSRVF